MPKYLIDENLPIDLEIWSSIDFVHVLHVQDCETDSDIWKYAIDHSLVILTKDADFYHRYLSTLKSPKIVWFRVGNKKKLDFNLFITAVWKNVESLLETEYFIIVGEEYIETI